MMIRDEYERLETLKYLNELEAAPEEVPSRAFHYENYKSNLRQRMDRSNDPLGIYPDVSPPRYDRGAESWEPEQEKVRAKRRSENRPLRQMNVRNFNKANLKHVSPPKRPLLVNPRGQNRSNGGNIQAQNQIAMQALSQSSKASPRSPRSPRTSPRSPRTSPRSPRVSPRSQGGNPVSNGGRKRNSPLTFFRSP